MEAEYKKVSLIGSGTFGKVWLVHHLPTGRRRVIKEVAVTSLTDKEKKQALTEVEVLARCRHANVIRYRGAFLEDRLLNIVMSYADGGDLHMRIQKQRGVHFPEPVVLDWFVQIVFALHYIHGLHIVHRDLKTQNIFLSGDNMIKLADFGIARVLGSTADHAMTAVGTPYYLSPEICQQQPYNYKSDMWSLGCVLYELCSLTHPFDGENIAAIVIKILNGTYAPIPSRYSALLEDLVRVLLHGEAEARPSAEQILWVPLLQKYVQGHVNRSAAMTPSRSAMTPSVTKQTPAAMTPSVTKQTPAAMTSSVTKQTPAAMTPSVTKQTPAAMTPSVTKQTPVAMTPSVTKQTPAAMTPSVTKQTLAAMTPSVTKQTPAAMTASCVKQTPSPTLSSGRRVASSSEAEKENILPVSGVKRARCISQSTPKSEAVVTNTRVSNSAECMRESVLARRKAVSKSRPSPTLSLYRQVLRHAHNNSPDRDPIITGGSPTKSSPIRKICSKTYTVRAGLSAAAPENHKGLKIAPEMQVVAECEGSPRRKHAVREKKDNHSWSRPVHRAPRGLRTPGGQHDRRVLAVNTHREMQVGRIQKQRDVSNVEEHTEIGNSDVKFSQPQGQSDVKFSQPQGQSDVKFSQPQGQSDVKFSQPQGQSDVKFSQPQGQSDVKFSQPQGQSDVKFSQPEVPFSSTKDRISRPDSECLRNNPKGHLGAAEIPRPSTPQPNTHQLTPTHTGHDVDEALRLSYNTFCHSQKDAYPLMEKLRSDLEKDLGTQRLHDLQRVIERSREEKMTYEQLCEQLGSEVKVVLPRLFALMQLEAIVSM